MAQVALLHLYLEKTSPNTVRLRYFETSNRNAPVHERILNPSAIQHLLSRAQKDYFFHTTPNGDALDAGLADQVNIGKQLYDWLDAEDRYLERSLSGRRDLLALAFSGDSDFLHLPWELLHDGAGFLITRRLLPLRWMYPEGHTEARKPENRALHALFMACSPDNVQPVLDFEQEESAILDATERLPMHLVVEETGNLEEMSLTIQDYGERYFDVVHLTGHGTDEPPAFYTEDEIGNYRVSEAGDLMEALRRDPPTLLFLSGCHTGGLSQGKGTQALTERLAREGFPAVLGWARSVTDQSSSKATAVLFKELSAGMGIVDAVYAAVNALYNIRPPRPDWHYLRLFVCDHLPGALITKGRHAAPKPTLTDEFLDEKGMAVKVPSRKGFVGRRKVLRDCLRVLRDPSGQKIGVVLAGMGGLGKSSVVSRLRDRLKDRSKSLLWIGAVDEHSLRNRLAEATELSELRKMFIDANTTLSDCLRILLEDEPKPDKRLLLIFDDFEKNFETNTAGEPDLSHAGGLPRLKPVVAQWLTALTEAIRKVHHTLAPQILITSRYTISSEIMWYFTRIDMPDMDATELRKLLDVKGADHKKYAEKSEDYTRVIKLAGGNPRLLEWLQKLIEQPGLNQQAIFDTLAEKTLEFREALLLDCLLDYLPAPVRQCLDALCMFHLPVTATILEAILSEQKNITNAMEHCAALGLIEISKNLYDISGYHYKAHNLLQNEVQILDSDKAAIYAEALMESWQADEDWRDIAHLEEILRFAVQGNSYQIADFVTRELANLYRIQGNVVKAITLYQQSLEINENIGNIRAKSVILYELASLYSVIGDLEKAMILYQQSLEINEMTGDMKGAGATLYEIAYLYRLHGDLEKSMTLYQKSLQLHENLGDARSKGATLHAMANLYTMQGDIGNAMALYQQSLELNNKIGDIIGAGATFHAMAHLYRLQGDLEKAMILYQKSLEIDEMLGNKLEYSITNASIAQIFTEQGNYDQALKLLSISVEILKGIGAKRELGQISEYMQDVIKLRDKQPLTQLTTVFKMEAQFDILSAFLHEQFQTNGWGEIPPVMLEALSSSTQLHAGDARENTKTIQVQYDTDGKVSSKSIKFANAWEISIRDLLDLLRKNLAILFVEDTKIKAGLALLALATEFYDKTIIQFNEQDAKVLAAINELPDQPFSAAEVAAKCNALFSGRIGVERVQRSLGYLVELSCIEALKDEKYKKKERFEVKRRGA